MSSEIQKEFHLTSKIGSGNFSTVFLAKHLQTQEIVAIKTMKNHIPIAIKQAQILKKINHPNVIKLYKFQKSKNKQQVMIVLQYVPQNILELYEAQQYGLKQDQVKCILFQSCMGLYHIHKKGIIHRDIKPENIMINRNKAQVKLIDFGLAIQQEMCVTDYVATRWYRAPQNLLGTKQYTVAIDIFSLGCVIVQLYLGSPLFPGANNIDQISKILTMLEEPTPQSWKKGYEMLLKLGLHFSNTKQTKKANLKAMLSSCSEGLIKLIQKMLILNPSKRITAQEILKDPYFNDIQKIIPPYVYDRYLTDFKSVRSNIMKEAPKPQKRNDSRERVRFMSQQKGFGTFSSFKSHNPLNKFKNQITRQRQSFEFQKSDSSNNLSFQKIIPDCRMCDQGNTQTNAFRKSAESCFNKNLRKKNYQMPIPLKAKNEVTEVSSSLKQSIQKYEKNILKLSTSLKNIKLLKSAGQSQGKQSQEVIQFQQLSDSKKQIKSTETLRFRGFNQPKQKISMKETGSTFIRKNPVQNEEKADKLPMKNKKVMEYLQKFQTIANQTQGFRKNQLENNQSEPTVYESVTSAPKKLLITSNSKPYLKRSAEQKQQLQSNSINSSMHLNLNSKQKNSFYHNQSCTNLMSQSFQRQSLAINQNQAITSAERIYYNSPQNSLKRRFDMQKKYSFQSPQKNSIHQTVVKFNSFNRQQPNMQTQFISTQNSIRSSRAVVQEQQNQQINSARSSQTFFNYPKNLNSSNYFNGSKNLMNLSEMNISPNRPIQNKIKLIAVRDNFPLSLHDNSQSFSTTPFSSVKVSRNPSYYQSSPIFVEKNRQNLVNNSNFQSPQKQYHYIRSSHQLYPQQYQQKPNLIEVSQQKTKHFKSLQHKQFYSTKIPSSNRYSVNISQDSPNIGQAINYTTVNQNQITKQTNHNPQVQQKNHQTILSQLRQSITGLTQTLNQGSFLPQKSQKYNKKNISINLNLNIYQKSGIKKR